MTPRYLADFRDPEDLLHFVRTLSDRFHSLGFEAAAAELRDWAETSFTSASEFIGELGVHCTHILQRDGAGMPSDVRDDLDRCLRAFREAFPFPGKG